jgi:hypothetical protein
MGQYYRAIILAENEVFIRAWLDAFMYNQNGSKIVEHSYVGNSFMLAVEHFLSREGPFYKSRLVWAGDYANDEPEGRNLYSMAEDKDPLYRDGAVVSHPYIVNHIKKEYVIKPRKGAYHPLSLLTAEGNGRGGGDYHGSGTVGRWARDIISMEDDIPEGYTLHDCGFQQDSQPV